MAVLDPALLEALRRRDLDALRQVADAHGRMLYRAARGMGCAASDAEDLVQDVFVTFLDGLDRFEGRAQLGTWLYGILHFKMQERRRGMRRQEGQQAIDEIFEAQFDARGHWISTPDDPLTALEGARAGDALADCLDRLPETQRAAFHLRVVEEMSAAEAGNVLGQTVTHIGVLLYRARMGLRECLRAKGVGQAR